MSRRTYSSLGYEVWRARHVMPTSMVEKLDQLAKAMDLDRSAAMEVMVARYIGAMEGAGYDSAAPTVQPILERGLAAVRDQ